MISLRMARITRMKNAVFKYPRHSQNPFSEELLVTENTRCAHSVGVFFVLLLKASGTGGSNIGEAKIEFMGVLSALGAR
jgi:hypothetical protein